MISGTTQVTAPIAPTSLLDIYPTHDAFYGLDGLRNVDTLGDRNNISDLRRRAGMIVGVLADDSYWRLKNVIWDGTDNDWEPFLTGGGSSTVGLNQVAYGDNITGAIISSSNFVFSSNLLTLGSTGLAGQRLQLITTDGSIGWMHSTNVVNLLSYISSNRALIGTNTNHDLGFTTNGQEHFTILNNGNVGIGTNSPSSKLYVNASIQNETIILNNDDITGSSYFGLAQSGGIKAGMILLNSNHPFIPKTLIIRNLWDNGGIRINGGSSDSNIMFFDTTTLNIGVGMTNPLAQLDILATGSGKVGININTSSTQDSILTFATNNSSTQRGKIWIDDATQKFNFYTLNSDTIFYNGVGLAQVKTLTLFTNTTAKFENTLYVGSNITFDGLDSSFYPINISSSNATLTRFKLQNQGGVQTDIQIANFGGSSSMYLQALTAGTIAIDNRAFGDLLFTNTGIEAMRLKQNGNLGIGINPTSLFHTFASTSNVANIESSASTSTIIVDSYSSNVVGSGGSSLILKNNLFNRCVLSTNNAISLVNLTSTGGYWLLLSDGNSESIGLGQGGNYIKFNTNLTTKMVIDGITGNVAINDGTLIDAKFNIIAADSGSINFAMKINNLANSPLLYVKNNGTVSMPTLQVGNAGLSSGDLYVDTAANILANGDLIIGRKV